MSVHTEDQLSKCSVPMVKQWNYNGNLFLRETSVVEDNTDSHYLLTVLAYSLLVLLSVLSCTSFVLLHFSLALIISPPLVRTVCLCNQHSYDLLLAHIMFRSGSMLCVGTSDRSNWLGVKI